jgi:hypothetical protein
MSECSWRIARDVVKPADLIFRALAQAPLISRLARLGTESHAPIATSGEAEFSTAMVAA